MKLFFCLRLAQSNIRKNYRFFVPRMLAEAGLLGCLYIAYTLAKDERIGALRGGDYVAVFLPIGTGVLALLAVILMFYTNSFLMRQRRREFGIYNILGMEKRHIGRVLFWETVLSSLASLLAGLLLGVLFYKLCSLLICRLLQTEIVFGFYFLRLSTLLPPAAFFLALDLLTFVKNRVVIAKMQPAQLLQSSAAGEKEPRVKWLLLAIGTVSMGGGYFLARRVSDPLEALNMFFPAVLLVILGTYFLFEAGSIFILKLLKNTKKYYYRPGHMPAVAGLLYRMKQNAVGLASVAILATAVLVMISTTFSLYAGMQQTLDSGYPFHLFLYTDISREDGAKQPIPADVLEEALHSAAKKQGLKIEAEERQESLTVSYSRVGSRFLTSRSGEGRKGKLVTVHYIAESLYSSLTGKQLGLQAGEIVLCRISSEPSDMQNITGTLELHGKPYKIKENLTSFPVFVETRTAAAEYGAVVSDEELKTVFADQKAAYGEEASEMTAGTAVRFTDRDAACEAGPALVQEVDRQLAEYAVSRGAWYSRRSDSYWDAREGVLGMYGSFLFLGILLGAVCLFATALIIYYKQISEGCEDSSRYRIMQKIGMSRAEVRKTIRTQVRLVFFLPLAAAGVHLAAAYPMLLKMLNLLMLSDASVFRSSALVTFAVFSLVYVLIYGATSRTYYKIVR